MIALPLAPVSPVTIRLKSPVTSAKATAALVPPDATSSTLLAVKVIDSTFVDKSNALSDSTSPLSVNTPPVRVNAFTSAPSNVIALPLAPVSPVTIRLKSPVTSAKATAALVPPDASIVLAAAKVIAATLVSSATAPSIVRLPYNDNPVAAVTVN